MSEKLPGLVVEVEARIDRLERGLRQADARQRRFSTDIERNARRSADRLSQTYGRAGSNIAAGMTRMLRPLAAGIVGIGTAQAVANIGRVVKGIAQIGDEAKRAGVSVEAFQEWKFVAEQNRIGIDAMVDGLKELNLRADEFIVTGSGPAAEAFARLGFNAAELGAKLKDPSALLLEIFGRLNRLDRAARIRVVDEIFGGSAGERFVQLIDQGEAGLRRTIDRAHEVGAVLDEEMIRKAAELDRRWGELQTRVGNFFKTLAVGAADAAVKVVTLRNDLDEMFRSYEQTKALLGEGPAEVLSADDAAADAHAEQIGLIRQQYERLAESGRALAPELEMVAAQLYSYGQADAAGVLADAAGKMRELAGEMEDGSVNAEEFEARLGDLLSATDATLASLADIDRVQFTGTIAAVGALIRKLADAVGVARTLRATLPGGAELSSGPVVLATEAGSFWDRPGADQLVNPPTATAPTTSPRPAAAPPLTQELYDPPKSGGGGGGGGGGADELQRLIDRTKADIRQLQAEAVEFAAVAVAGKGVGDALEYARRRAELFTAAQAQGRQLTPELRAELDALAASYATAGKAAEDAADRLERVQEAGERGAEALSGIFQSVLNGSMSAGDALAALLQQIAAAQLDRLFQNAAQNATGGGIFGFIGRLLGFERGGFTGPGGRLEPAGVVHRGEYVLSAPAVERLGVANLDALHHAARRGYAGGGLVTDAPAKIARTIGAAPGVPVVTINAPVTVNATGGSPEANADLAERMAKSIKGEMRALVGEELRRAIRPGGVLRT